MVTDCGGFFSGPLLKWESDFFGVGSTNFFELVVTVEFVGGGTLLSCLFISVFSIFYLPDFL